MGRKNALIKPGKHWDAVHFSSHIMMDALAKHLLGLAPYGMTDIGEVLETYCQLKDTSEQCWVQAWGEIAARLQAQAESKVREGHMVSAASLYLRASTYWRVALMCYSSRTDSRIIEYCNRSHECYETYLSLSDYPGTYIEIPYENTYLPGHFYRSSVAEERAPLMILVPGRDTWAEDTRWVYDGLLKRGIHCLCFDGPGQGFALRLQKMPFRPDWENVVTPVIDFALDCLKGIDGERVGVLGISFGGFLVPRACAFEKRIKVCVADPGNMNWGGHFADIFERVMKLPSLFRPKMVGQLMDDYAWKHGVSKDEIIEELRKYDNSGILDMINCRMLVLDGTAEMNKGDAKIFFDSLKSCQKEYKLFDEKSTAQCHSQMGGYGPASEFLCDWVAEYL